MTFSAGPSRRAIRGDRMRLLLSAAFAGLTLAPAGAADLFGTAAPLSIPAANAPTAVEIGSNWYLRGDIGVGFDDAPTVSLAAVPSAPAGLLSAAPASGGESATFAGDLGVGYRFNDYLRFDATWTYWTSPSRTRSFGVVCPYGLVGVNNSTGAAAGYLYDTTNTCAGTTSLNEQNDTFLANAYVDLGTYAGFTPYVGGGAGVNVGFMKGSSSFITSANGSQYQANLTNSGFFPSVWVNQAGQPIAPQPNVAFTQQNWNRSLNSTTYRVAWSLAAGIGYQLNPSATLDVGYRYINGGETSVLVNPQTGLTVKNRNVSQQILVGVRYVLQ